MIPGVPALDIPLIREQVNDIIVARMVLFVVADMQWYILSFTRHFSASFSILRGSPLRRRGALRPS
jgi:hypothetical protein